MKIIEFRFKMYPKDFDKVRNFYKNELQFNIVHEWNREGQSRGVMFDVGETILELLSHDTAHQPIAGADLSLEVEDVWSVFESMKDKEYLRRGLVDNSWGDTSFHILDPEGLQITFFTRRDQGTST